MKPPFSNMPLAVRDPGAKMGVTDVTDGVGVQAIGP